MKVLMLNGSPHKNGCTFTALTEVAKSLAAEDTDSEIVWLGSGPVHDCTACGGCSDSGRCVFTGDAVNEIIDKAEQADGFVFGSPVYYAHPSGLLLSVLDRCFYAGGAAFSGKPGAAVVSARRAGTTASLDVINKYFGIAGMPVVGSTYWNMVHGRKPEDVLKDAEGLQTLRNLGRDMAYLIRSLAAADGEKPVRETGARTNFIR